MRPLVATAAVAAAALTLTGCAFVQGNSLAEDCEYLETAWEGVIEKAERRYQSELEHEFRWVGANPNPTHGEIRDWAASAWSQVADEDLKYALRQVTDGELRYVATVNTKCEW